MKALSVLELDNVVACLAPLKGLRLQEVQTSAQDVVLGFYSSHGILWLWLDLNAISPTLLPWTELPLRPDVHKTPLQLFLRAHFVGRVLREVSLSAEYGRLVRLQFGKPEDGLELEVRLFAHARNLIARSGDKQIHWQKPQPLTLASESAPATREPRTLEQLREEWLLLRKGKSSGGKSGGKKNAPVDIKSRIEKDLNKKESALKKVQEELRRKQDLPWRALGDWLKANQSLDVGKEWEPFVDRRRKLAWNIEQAYTKAREAEGKIYGTEKRLHSLEEEILKLREKLTRPARELNAEVPSTGKVKPSLNQIEAQGRTLRLSDDMMVVMGKSAVDNMKILRKARAWDLWFHLRDFPSSHAVLLRNKGAQVGDGKIFEVATWFVRNHLGSKAASHAGEKFDIVIAECRHVKPIRGDKIGRVTYHDERILIFQFPG